MSSLQPGDGTITCIVGPMYSGKSTRLIEHLQGWQGPTRCFTDSRDTRYGTRHAITHDGVQWPAEHYQEPIEIASEPTLYAFEECQWYPPTIVQTVTVLRDAGHQVVCAGLDLDVKAHPWTITAQLAAIADHVERLRARCHQCGRPAPFSYLLSGEAPVGDEPLILVGGAEQYEARCERCFVPAT